MKKGINTLIIAMMMLLSITVFGSTLEKGTYSIQNETYHENAVGAGMSRSYTETTSGIEVNNNGIYATITMNTTSVMGDFTVKVRSEERRVGKECTYWCSYRWTSYL